MQEGEPSDREICFKSIGGQKICQRTIKNALSMHTALGLAGSSSTSWNFPPRRQEASKAASPGSHARDIPTEQAGLLTERSYSV